MNRGEKQNLFVLVLTIKKSIESALGEQRRLPTQELEKGIHK